jgi:DNA-binding GntR family transcriptional regulator
VSVDLEAEDQAMYLNIYDVLRQGIMSGAVQPGQTLSNRSIAAQIGVSTTPVRDALRRLVADGVLQAVPKSAFIVPPVSIERFKQLLELRVLLERFAAERAARAISASDLEKLSTANDIYADRTTSPSERLRANRDFHFLIYRSGGMDDLVTLIELLWVRVGPLLHFTTSSTGHEIGIAHHRAIMAALRDREGTAAAAAIEADLRSAGSRIEENLA